MPRILTLPANTAANATAPPGSTTKCRRSNTQRIAAATSWVVTATPFTPRACKTSKLIAWVCGVCSASHVVGCVRSFTAKISPASNDRIMSSQPSGSTMVISASGQASESPDASPPPPQHATIWSGPSSPRACNCARISMPTLPCPSITHGSPKAWTKVAPVRATISAAMASRSCPGR